MIKCLKSTGGESIINAFRGSRWRFSSQERWKKKRLRSRYEAGEERGGYSAEIPLTADLINPPRSPPSAATAAGYPPPAFITRGRKAPLGSATPPPLPVGPSRAEGGDRSPQLMSTSGRSADTGDTPCMGAAVIRRRRRSHPFTAALVPALPSSLRFPLKLSAQTPPSGQQHGSWGGITMKKETNLRSCQVEWRGGGGWAHRPPLSAEEIDGGGAASSAPPRACAP